MLNELALEAVAKAEKLKISAAEKKAEYERLAKEYNMEVEQIKAAVDEETLSEDLLYQKAAKFVLENAKVGKAPAKKAAKKDEGEAAEKKPAAKKTTAKAKTDAAEKKPTAKKTAKKAEE